MNYLSIDVGTTGCKCQLFSQTGEILAYLFDEYDFLRLDGENYVDVDAALEKLKGMVGEIAAKHDVRSVCVSSLGEAFVLLDKDDNILFYPMLYTDPRGEDEAKEITSRIGAEKAFSITGVVPHSMYSLSKLLWIKKRYPDVFAKADKVMLVADYIGYKLCGKRVIDYALASRTGAFDVEKMVFSKEILDAFDIPMELFSIPMRAGSIVGEVRKEWGMNAVLVLGSHDQVCTSLGAGALETGDAVDGMGTVECITVVFDRKPDDFMMGKQGYPCVPYAIEGKYCTYMLNYSCGSTVNWLRKKIMHGYSGEEKDFFAYMEKGMKDEPTELLVLPYCGGASTPFQDRGARGAILGLTTETDDQTLYKALLEGTAFEMRLNANVATMYGVNVKKAVATGGGAKGEKWMQLKADIQNIPFKVLRSSEGGLCGCAMLQAVALGGAKDLHAARDIFVRHQKKYTPDPTSCAAYEKTYKKYEKLYKTIKEIT